MWAQRLQSTRAAHSRCATVHCMFTLNQGQQLRHSRSGNCRGLCAKMGWAGLCWVKTNDVKELALLSSL
eukprot:1159586-Pelagomonas_calceolata.AAC.1